MRTANAFLFRVTITLKRSKSDKFARFARIASFLAHDVFSHFSTRPSAFSAALNTVTHNGARIRSCASFAATQDVQLQVREREPLERIHLPRNARRGAVNQNAVLIQDVDDNRQLAMVVAVVDEYSAPYLNESGETLSSSRTTQIYHFFRVFYFSNNDFKLRRTKAANGVLGFWGTGKQP